MSKPIGIHAVVGSFGLIALAIIIPASIHAASQRSKSETEVNYRRSLFTVLGVNFGPLGAMAEGEIPFDAAQAQKRADRLAFLAPMLREAFPPDSNGVANTAARPEIWSDGPAFERELKAFIEKTTLLTIAGKSNDSAKIKQAIQEIDDACTSCHYDFKFRR